MTRKKAIIWSRVSTTQQEMESQKKDLTAQAIKDGFKPKDLIYIGKEGASAIKLNKIYQQEVDELIRTIEEQSDVSTIYVWEVSRLARNEVAFYKMKSKIIENHIQLICNVPSIRLFDANGELNSGSEITLNLLVTLAKQEMEIKKKRFARGKKQRAEDDKFAGGIDKFGYYHDKNGNYHINEEEAEIVRLMYHLRADKGMSKRGICIELKNRGITRRGKIFGATTIQSLLSEIAYTGVKCTHRYCKYDRALPMIIPQELFDRAQEVTKANRNNNKKGKNLTLAFKILKCPECGGAMTYFGTRDMYRCLHSKHKELYIDEQYKCYSSCTVDSDIIESLLWQLAKFKERKAILNRKAEDKEMLIAEKKALNAQIPGLDKRLSNLKKGLDNIANLYCDGELSEKSYTERKKDNKHKQKVVQDEIQGIKHQLRIIDKKLKSFDEQMSINEYLKLCAEIEMTSNITRMYDIVSTYISKAVVSYKDETKKDKVITIYYTDGTSERFFKPYKEQNVIADGFPHYVDESGVTIYEVFRFDLKKFSKIHRGSLDAPESVYIRTSDGMGDNTKAEYFEPVTPRSLQTYFEEVAAHIKQSGVKKWKIKYRTM